MAHIWLTLAIVAVLVISHGTVAKRGCSAFGHSCFGGHGKRSEPPKFDSAMTNEVFGPVKPVSQEEIPTEVVKGYPRVGYAPESLSNEDAMIPVRGGRPVSWDFRDPTKEELKFKLRTMLKLWLDKYKNSRTQLNSDSEDSIYTE